MVRWFFAGTGWEDSSSRGGHWCALMCMVWVCACTLGLRGVGFGEWFRSAGPLAERPAGRLAPALLAPPLAGRALGFRRGTPGRPKETAGWDTAFSAVTRPPPRPGHRI